MTDIVTKVRETYDKFVDEYINRLEKECGLDNSHSDINRDANLLAHRRTVGLLMPLIHFGRKDKSVAELVVICFSYIKSMHDEGFRTKIGEQISIKEGIGYEGILLVNRHEIEEAILREYKKL